MKNKVLKVKFDDFVMGWKMEEPAEHEINLTEVFDEIVNEEDRLFLRFKEQFINEFIDGKGEVPYHFCVDVMASVCDEPIICTAYLRICPNMDNIGSKLKLQICEDYCDNDISNFNEYDVGNYAELPVLAQENIEYPEDDWYSNDFCEFLAKVAVVIPYIARTIGFNMDKVVNMIGTTNWDLWEGLVEDIDPFAQSLKRAIAEKESEVN